MVDKRTQNTKDTILLISVFYAIFFAMYIFTVYLQSMSCYLINNSALSVIAGILVRLITWTLPVLLFLKNPFDYLKLKNNIPKGIIAGIAIGSLLLLLRILFIYFGKGSVAINLKLNPHIWFEGILFVGLSEEVVFRGFLLQKIEEISNFWIANIVSTLLFIITHIPYWILIQDYTFGQAMFYHSLSILWLSLFLGYVLKKTQSLWSCIIIHSFNNFMSCAIN